MPYNIFIKINLPDSKKFLYSHEAGLRHLKETIDNLPLFHDLIASDSLLESMVCKLIYGFPNGQMYTMQKYHAKYLIIRQADIEAFEKRFVPWLNQLQGLLGSDNIREVELSLCESVELNQMEGLALIRKLDAIWLSRHLGQELPEQKEYKKIKI